METLNGDDLPQDVIIGILLRLPVKSLARFKCVSKSWYAIITSHNFVYKHLGNKNDGCLIAHYATGQSDLASVVLFPDKTLADSSYHAFELPFSRAILHGPCNGIFFVTFGEQDYALWNPATKEYLDLPSPAFPGGFCWDECCGFGLDPVTNDYKVIVIQRLEEEDSLLIKVHTLGTDSWKDLEDLAQCERLYENTSYSYLNGNYYWWGSKHDGTDVVVSFDMGNDTFQEIEVPNLAEPALKTLAVYNDLIAFLTFQTEEAEALLDLWVLNECWTKQITIGPHPGVKHPIGCWKNGELLLQSNTDRLLLCEPTKEIRDLGFQGTDYCIGVHVYKESLISIKDECEYRQRKEHQSHGE
uniref:F-box domain-containing protein n=2 Tax=Rhizophora mucronata TaxID=61149 RepID=A0A2P2JE44_RHIMU